MALGDYKALLTIVGNRIRNAGVFGEISVDAQVLRCQAKVVESDAMFRIEIEDTDPPQIWIGLFTTDRWLSESIEADLMFKGDRIEDLLEEELVDQGLETRLTVEHFRDDQKYFVFRSALKTTPSQNLHSETLIDMAVATLLAFEACFRELGDMRPADELA